MGVPLHIHSVLNNLQKRTTSLQRTKAGSQVCPSFGGSNVLLYCICVQLKSATHTIEIMIIEYLIYVHPLGFGRDKCLDHYPCQEWRD